MKFKENDTVRILCKKDENINIEDIGVIIMTFEYPNEAYEVEIVDENGNFKTDSTFKSNELELIKEI